jgi:hypothetical protein
LQQLELLGLLQELLALASLLLELLESLQPVRFEQVSLVRFRCSILLASRKKIRKELNVLARLVV